MIGLRLSKIPHHQAPQIRGDTMGAEMPTAAAVSPENAHRSGLAYPNPLAGTPGEPNYAASVKKADGSELKVACPTSTRLSLALMNMNAVMGGAACHWGGPSGFAEIISALHGIMFEPLKDNKEWHTRWNFVNDAGHAENGIYAVKANYGFAGMTMADLKGFRSVESKLTGHGEGHIFPEGVMVSNGPLGSGLPIAQGLSLADRLANNTERTTICVMSDGAMMEGEAREAVAAIPGLAAKGKTTPFVMVLSDNNTKLSGRIDEQSFSMVPSFDALAAQGWDVVEVAEGHDLQAVFTAIEAAIGTAEGDATKPVAVWVKTVKGKGVVSTEESASGGHGFPLGNPSALRAFVNEIAESGGCKELPPVYADWLAELEAAGQAKEAAAAAKPKSDAAPTGKIQGGFAKAMIACAEEGLPVVSVSADLAGSTGVGPFQTAFPQFTFDVGIAESNMVNAATGFSKQGYIPVVDTFAQFGVTKGALPICMANLSQSPIIGVFSHIGFQDAADGASHQGLMYLAMTSAIPYTTVYCPASAEEAEWAMAHTIRDFADKRAKGETPNSVLFFCGRENFPISLVADGKYEWGKAQIVADTTSSVEGGKDKSVVVSANASSVAYAQQAVDQLAEQGIGAVLLNNAIPNQPDLEAHTAALARCGGRLVTVEDHQAIGGAGSMLVTALAEASVDFSVKLLGVRGHFGQSSYTAVELYDKHGIGPAGITEAAASFFA